MIPPEHDTDERWCVTSEFTWTERAYDLMEQQLLHTEAKSDGGVLRTRVSGLCPRCSGRLDDRQVHTAVGDPTGSRGGTAEEGNALEPVVVQVDVTCGCGLAHADAPEDTTGCGVTFRVELVAEGAQDPTPGAP